MDGDGMEFACKSMHGTIQPQPRPRRAVSLRRPRAIYSPPPRFLAAFPLLLAFHSRAHCRCGLAFMAARRGLAELHDLPTAHARIYDEFAGVAALVSVRAVVQ